MSRTRISQTNGLRESIYKNMCYSRDKDVIIFLCFRLSHRLKFEEQNPILAKDANTKDDDWFEIYDPRNPLNKRRRGENPIKTKK